MRFELATLETGGATFRLPRLRPGTIAAAAMVFRALLIA